MGKTAVYYYLTSNGKNPVGEFIDSLSFKQQTKILRIYQYIKEYGLSAILPHTRKLTGTPLWEIRILGKDNIRIIYAVIINNTVLILHIFIKKSAKTSARDLNTALYRYKDYLIRVKSN